MLRTVNIKEGQCIKSLLCIDSYFLIKIRKMMMTMYQLNKTIKKSSMLKKKSISSPILSIQVSGSMGKSMVSVLKFGQTNPNTKDISASTSDVVKVNLPITTETFTKEIGLMTTPMALAPTLS